MSITSGTRGRRRTLVALLGAALLAATAACEPLDATSPAAGSVEDDEGLHADAAAGLAAPESAPTTDTTATLDAARGQSALVALGLLEVKGRAPKTGYDRDLFAYRGVDLDGNGCDTRNDVLRRDLTAVTLKPGTQDCVVLSGTLADPYSGTSIPFVRGESTSADVQIDHVVALSDAWQKGAQRLDDAARQRLGNDPLNLLAVSGPLNTQKGDGDAATWLPPNTAYRCAYVARQVAVKYAYGLWVTAAERDAIAGVLASCPDEPLPAGSTLPPERVAPAPVDPAPVDPAPVPAPAPGGGVPANPGNAVNCGDFATWSEAQAWFETYLPHFGDVAELDGDDNGVACERLPGAP
ncbi:HNH endonuclease family protein [Cellulomonas algicola]|uniref:HNH endonuclease family protein n=1 Tax=Cellulomonas algicola TaxID=2071633 RepID=UPI00355686B4